MTARSIADFVKEKKEALLSLDKKKLLAFSAKYNNPEDDHLFKYKDNNEVFWGLVHKAITGTDSLPIEFRKASKKYLDEHGLTSLDDGDL